MIRRLLMVVTAAAIPLGIGLGTVLSSGTATASTPKYVNAGDAVGCGSAFGSVQILPALTGGTPVNSTEVKIKGTLLDCQDTTGGAPDISNINGFDTGSFQGTFSGTLFGNNNDLTSLFGCSHFSAPGAIIVKWKGYADVGGTFETLVNTTSTIYLGGGVGNAGWVVGALQPVTEVPATAGNAAGFGSFSLGGGQACSNAGMDTNGSNNADPAPATTPNPQVLGGFTGGDGGIHSKSLLITTGDTDSYLGGQTSTASGSKTIVTLGLGQLQLG